MTADDPAARPSDAASLAAAHGRCGERLKCPCWLDGAREESQMHRDRMTTRGLTGYIRALGDNDPAMTEQEIADAVARVYGSAALRADTPTLATGAEASLPLASQFVTTVNSRADTPAGLDVERLARALVTVTREQAGEPDGEGWPGYVHFGKPHDVFVVLLVTELAEAVAAEYARLAAADAEGTAREGSW